MEDDIVDTEIFFLEQAIRDQDWQRVRFVHEGLKRYLANPPPSPRYRVGDTIEFTTKERWGMPIKSDPLSLDNVRAGERVTGEIRKRQYWVKIPVSTFENKIEEWMYWIYAPKYHVEDWVYESELTPI